MERGTRGVRRSVQGIRDEGRPNANGARGICSLAPRLQTHAPLRGGAPPAALYSGLPPPQKPSQKYRSRTCTPPLGIESMM